MEDNIKISYAITIGDTGVYNQRINGLSRKTIDKLNDAIRTEIALKYPRKAEYSSTSGYAECFLKVMGVDKNRIYINHTQRRFINIYLKLNLKDRNTFLTIIN